MSSYSKKQLNDSAKTDPSKTYTKTCHDIYESKERTRMSLAKLLRKSGVVSPRVNFMLMRGLVMAKGQGYIWLCTSTGDWRIRVPKAMEYELFTEHCFVSQIFPSFHGMLIYGEELKPGMFDELMRGLDPLVTKIDNIIGCGIYKRIQAKKEAVKCSEKL
jgi:hypothetical protein